MYTEGVPDIHTRLVCTQIHTYTHTHIHTYTHTHIHIEKIVRLRARDAFESPGECLTIYLPGCTGNADEYCAGKEGHSLLKEDLSRCVRPHPKRIFLKTVETENFGRTENSSRLMGSRRILSTEAPPVYKNTTGSKQCSFLNRPPLARKMGEWSIRALDGADFEIITTNKIPPVRRLVLFSPTCSLLLPCQASPTARFVFRGFLRV